MSDPYLEEDPKEFVSITTVEVFDPEIYSIITGQIEKRCSGWGVCRQSYWERRDLLTNTILRQNFYRPTLQNQIPALLNKQRKPGCKTSTAVMTKYFMIMKDRPESEQEDILQLESMYEPHHFLEMNNYT